MEPREKELAEMARKLGFASNPQPEQESVLQTISDTIRRGVQKVFECAKCARKFRITNARENGIYKCASCNLVMTEAHDTTVEIVKGEKVELVLDETIPQDVQKAIADPANVFGRYVLVEMIGEGAMGSVHRAYDVELSRYIALKFIKSERAEELKAEAKTLASLEHKNIARIYDIGSVRGKGFIAMQLINGVSLKWIEGDEAKAIDTVMTVAEAVEYAHKRGVVHRDLKPENIMLDTEGGVFVMDFGLATSHPDAGDIAGTPGYMAPEIAAGKSATAKSDVFSLGCTLYYMTAGRIPFELAGATDLGRVLERIRSGNTIPIRNVYPAIDRELEAIINKATAAEPEKRYPSAAEFGQDIRKFKMGYPVLAFSESTTYRAKKAILRNRVLAGVVIGALFVISIVGFLLFQKWKEKNLEESRTKTLIQEFLDDMAAAHTEALENRMAGYTYEQLCRIPARVERKYRKISEMGVRDHRVHYSLGRLYRIVGDETRALEEQWKALAIQPDFQEAHYEVGVLQFYNYRNLMDALRKKALGRISSALFVSTGGAAGAKWKEPSDEEIETSSARKLKEEARESFSKSAQTDVVKGIVAVMDKKIAHALQFLENPKEYDEDAVFFLVKLYCIETPAPAELVRRATDTLTKSLKKDKGNIRFFRERGVLNFSLGCLSYYEGGIVTDYFTDAAADFEAALRLHPDDSLALSWLGNVQSALGLFAGARGKDPTEMYLRAVATLKSGLERFKNDAELLMSLADVEINFGTYMIEHGNDGGDMLIQAIGHLTRSIEIDGSRFEVWTRRGLAHEDYGDYLKEKGADPLEVLERALSDYDKAISINRSYFEPWMHRGMVRSAIGNYMSFHGKDPTEHYAKSVSDIDEATKLKPDFYKAHLSSGVTKSNWASWLRNSGQDAVKMFREALDAFSKSIDINPGDHEAHIMRAFTLIEFGEYELESGKDPVNSYKLALEDADAAVKINPKDYEALLAKGNAHGAIGTLLADRGENPENAFTNSIKALEAAAAVNPNHCEIFDNLGNIRCNWGNYVRKQGREPSEFYALALADFDKSIKVNPSNFESWSGKGMVRLNWAGHLHNQGKDPAQLYLDGFKDYTEAIRLNDRRAELWKNRGGGYVNLVLYKGGRGEDPTEEARAARSDLTEATKLDAGDWHIFYMRGSASYNHMIYLEAQKRQFAKEAEEAASDFEKAAQLNPAMAEQLRRLIVELKQKEY